MRTNSQGVIGIPVVFLFMLSVANATVRTWDGGGTNNNWTTATNWVTPFETITDDGTNKAVVVNPPTGNRFYRLFKP